MKPNKKIQYGFYMLSMAVFFLVILILGTNIPVCFDSGAKFIGIMTCLTSFGIIIPIICMFAFIYIGYFFYLLKHRIKGTKLGPIIVKSANNINYDIMAFVGSFFLPLISFNVAEKWQHFLVLIILFVIIGEIYVRSSIYYTNPTLLVFGYKIYKVKGIMLGKEIECVIIIRDTIKTNDKLMYIPIDNYTYYAKKI